MRAEDWIKVEDRLPEIDEDVLVYNPLDYFQQVYIGYYNGKVFREIYGSLIRPTHWMPIVSPKEEKK